MEKPLGAVGEFFEIHLDSLLTFAREHGVAKKQHKGGRRIILIFAPLLAAAQPAPAPLHLAIRVDADDSCHLEWNGEVLDQDGLSARAKSWPDKAAAVQIDGSTETPYRCIGATIYTLQVAGFTRIGFVSAPPPRRVIVTIDQPCRLKINGRRVTYDGLRIETRRWKKDQPDLHFMPDKSARYQCVDKVLKIFRAAYVGKVGFIGNEAAEPSAGNPK